ncbi:topoisomerase DNA-binding C4 zinc finger domain-containing protein [Sphingomonas sp. CFBP 13706]|uniref:topoisomerase DNA-binding C4 zinc finger domain-containing protein n=1 Tax=Sphingomonas sp. CFBP 13706 TaxID=2775314 RepID=UPI00177C366D|nr:topoisomerase DNA-binding C4 zinc finger domain-containing protein [Sphingomonas sp. CFBP 13706]MBD8736242.1 topoisomerase DNA-binding C4 zinc finger domain-containing protein [Sphingomonas sp. CFBP 13706]
MRVGKMIGRGGEGEVYALADDPDRAVKIYGTPDAEREAKVRAMVAKRLSAGSDLVAFPEAVVTTDKGRFAGFVMRLVKGHTSLHELYSPGSRKIHFPKADYRFTVRAALNIAKGVAKVHDLGAVIGDINHSGILISDKAVAALIDADSFQFGSDHLCRVGVPEYTPPELQGRSLGGIVRTTDHDAFGLAVVLFQLLFMGRHPYVGRYSGGDMPIERAIAERRFAYSTLRDVGMSPPPGTARLEDFPAPIRAGFEAAFAAGSAPRPTAAQWVAMLKEFEGGLNRCGTNEVHYHPGVPGSCVWCRMERQIGILLFLPSFTLGGRGDVADPGAAGFNLGQVWAAIEAVRLPDPATVEPQLPSIAADPSDDVAGFRRELWKGRGVGVVLLLAAIAVLIGKPVLWIVYVPMGWFGLVAAFQKSRPPSRFADRYVRAETAFQGALSDWRRRIGFEEARQLRSSLDDAKADLIGLPQDVARHTAEYEANRRDAQLHDFLETFPIRRAAIRGVGPAKLAGLASYGIDTAADVVAARIEAVPGFGPVTARPLLEWRRNLTARFAYRAQHSPRETDDLRRIRQSAADRAAAHRVKLLRGAGDLRSVAANVATLKNVVDPVVARMHREREQALADLRALGVPVPNVALPSPSPPRPVPAPPSHAAPQARAGSPKPPPSSSPCPACGGRMLVRTARKGRNPGRQFLGCAAYPRCQGTRTI